VGRGRKTFGGLVAVVFATLGVGQAIGATETINSTASCCAYTKAAYTIDAGQEATFVNAGDGSHDVTATSKGPDGNLLFGSDTVASGPTPVKGTQYLSAGNYAFYCTVHPLMTAQLTVGAGTPVARPGVTLKVSSKKVDKVASSGKLLVKVTAQAASQDVVVTAKKGALKLGKAATVADLAAGASQTLKFKLSGSQKNKLDGLNSAKIKVSATVPFGTPAKTSRTLH
jgi:plastocyanin